MKRASEEAFRDFLEQVRCGRLSVEEGLEVLSSMATLYLGEIRLDGHRGFRCGIGEVVYCPGKTRRQLEKIADACRDRPETLIFSRMETDQAEAVGERLPGFCYDEVARIGYRKGESPVARGRVSVISAGAADQRVAAEASLVSELLGCEVDRHFDVGVAGLHRLLSVLQELRKADVVVAVAGMEAALPTVAAGLLDTVVIAVPTSAGYGTSLGGAAALLGVLNSCCPNVLAVNIDNGLGAGISASLIAGGGCRRGGRD
ncbi:MAG: nickel pincer cofactor biosynthesis protein LarB [Synergistaceae bacterium]|nr:nickel pincer cofactor biosynthesis protein LarB [Synergistaceae bacterium]